MPHDQRTADLHDRRQRGHLVKHERLNAGATIGATSGFVIGLVVDLAIGGSNVVSLLAMPIAAAVIGLTMGVLLSVRSSSPLDDPHRLPAPPPGPVPRVLGGPVQHHSRHHQADARQLDRKRKLTQHDHADQGRRGRQQRSPR
jgi:hypothetical protein